MPINGLSFHPDGSQLAVVSQTCDEAVLVFDVPSGEKRAALPGTGCHAICFSPTGSRLAVAANNDIVVWDLRQNLPSLQWRAHDSTINAVAFASDGEQLVSVSNDRQTIFWDLRNGGESRLLSGRHRSPVYCAVFADDGRSLVSGAEDGTLKIWHTAEAQELVDLPRQPSACRRVAISDDGTYLACLLKSGRITVFSTRDQASR